MKTDPRLAAALTLAQKRKHPYYAAAAHTLARQCGDREAMTTALRLGAASYRPEPCIYARTEERAEGKVIQLSLFEEAA